MKHEAQTELCTKRSKFRKLSSHLRQRPTSKHKKRAPTTHASYGKLINQQQETDACPVSVSSDAQRGGVEQQRVSARLGVTQRQQHVRDLCSKHTRHMNKKTTMSGVRSTNSDGNKQLQKANWRESQLITSKKTTMEVALAVSSKTESTRKTTHRRTRIN